MIVHAVDGTFELFRHYFALPSHIDSAGREVAATRGVLRMLVSMLEEGATHVGVATDHVVESFRNDLFADYKTGEGMEPGIASQFPIVEEGIIALGLKLCPMTEHEADDGMASIARVAAADPNVERIMLCTPDKDLAQCVVKGRILQVDKRNNKVLDFDDVVEKHGVEPESIPDYLALMGDTADGFPGLPGWGKKSASTVLYKYKHIENIPKAPGQWDVSVRGAMKLAATLVEKYDDAMLYKKLATLVHDAPTVHTVDELRWAGPTAGLAAFAKSIDAPDLVTRLEKLVSPS